MTKSTALLNKPRAVRYMEECRLDALIASSPVNVGYFSGYFCWLNSLLKEHMLRPGGSSSLPEIYAILTRDGQVSLIVNSIFAASAADLTDVDLHIFGAAGLDFAESPRRCEDEEILWELLSHPASCASAAEALVAVLRAGGLAGGQLGIEIDGMPRERTEALAQAMPRATLKNCSNLIRLIRAAKSPAEINWLTQAAEITENSAMESLRLACPGERVSDIVRHFHAQAAAAGAEFDHFAFSPRGFGIAIESNYRLRSDDVLYIDFGCKFGHYFSDTGLTLALTGLSQPLARRYEALHACVVAGEAQMRPGVRASEVQKAMMDEFAAHGLETCFPHGHGLGLEVRDYPILVPATGLPIQDDCICVSSDLPMEEGMVNNLEAFVFLPCVGSVHLERSFVVTESGSRELTRQKRDQPYFRATDH
jgi:Xaa-Pro dipeptidase